MTEQSKPKLENLELNRETLLDLSERQVEDVRGGWAGDQGTAPRETYLVTDCCATSG